ncbi:component of the polarisome [Ceratobasidium sp. 414]|nr:component of the polarisome [Ceratobasidium sp. 414]
MLTVGRQSSLSAATTYYSCSDFHSENHGPTHNLDFLAHQGASIEPAPATRAHYQEFRRSLGYSLRQVEFESPNRPPTHVHRFHVDGQPPNFRPDARKNLARLHRTQFMELVTDVYDEVVRMNNYRDGNVPIPSFVLARNDYHPKRNEARRQIAHLSPDNLKILMSDVFYELGRRCPNLKETESASRPVPIYQPSLGRLSLDTARAQVPTHQTSGSLDISRAPDGNPGINPPNEPNNRPADVVSSKMVGAVQSRT